MPAKKDAATVSVRKNTSKKNAKSDETDLPPVLKSPLEGKIKRKDIRRAVIAVSKRRALAAR